MIKKDSLGDRMKEFYENRYRFYFPNRLPIIVRIDGKAFHTYTKGLNLPFDKIFMTAMQNTTLDLVKNIYTYPTKHPRFMAKQEHCI